MAQTAICRHCGGMVTATVRICPHCGAANPAWSPLKRGLVLTLFSAGLTLLVLIFMLTQAGQP